MPFPNTALSYFCKLREKKTNLTPILRDTRCLVEEAESLRRKRVSVCVSVGGKRGGGSHSIEFRECISTTNMSLLFPPIFVCVRPRFRSCIKSACASRNETQNVAPTIKKQVLCWSLTLKCQIKGQITPRRLNEENMERTSALVS